MSAKKVAIVDGANIAYIEESEKGQPKVSNILAVREALEKRGYQPIIIVDASTRHQVDDPDQLERLIDEQIVRQAPSDTDADYFVLKIADKMKAVIISNDEYREFQDKYPWIEERRVPLMIVNGQVEFYREKATLP
jgi:hypothetical protein